MTVRTASVSADPPFGCAIPSRMSSSGSSPRASARFAYIQSRSDWLKGRWTSDRKSTRLNSSHSQISYAVFCLKKKKNLTYLRVFATDIPDLSPLRALTSLTSLDLFDTEITHVSPLRQLKSRRFITLHGTHFAH